MGKIGIKEIVIDRAEGPCGLCGPKRAVQTFAEADAQLRESAETACEMPGTYDKHDFVITFDDGEKYEGRIDVYNPKHGKTEGLREHVVDFCRCYGGLWKDSDLPKHLTPDRYRRFLANYTDEERAAIASFLEKYAIEEAN